MGNPYQRTSRVGFKPHDPGPLLTSHPAICFQKTSRVLELRFDRAFEDQRAFLDEICYMQKNSTFPFPLIKQVSNFVLRNKSRQRTVPTTQNHPAVIFTFQKFPCCERLLPEVGTVTICKMKGKRLLQTFVVAFDDNVIRGSRKGPSLSFTKMQIT